MVSLRYSSAAACPQYMTRHSAAADLYAQSDLNIAPNTVGKVPTGVWIAEVAWDQIPAGAIPELQIRARSSLAVKYQVTLANGLGTIDADYPDEICVLLHNFGSQEFKVKKGDRIAQIAFNLALRIPELPIGGQRTGGFGSTGA